MLAAALTCLLTTAPAAPPPVAWEVTGTSSTAVPAEPATSHRVERRFFEKQDHFLLKTGFSYLSRGDFYTNPGVALDLSWYPLEFFAIDLVSSTIFFSQLNSTATELRETFGLLPDSQKPYARITAGGRFAFAYGKVLIEELGAIVHLDASLGLHVGVLATDRAVNLGGDTGLSFQAAVFDRFLVWFDFSWFFSFEERSDQGTLASGPMGTVGVGLKLIALLVSLLAANPVGGVSTPTDDATVTARFLAGDLVTLRRARVLRAAAGEDVDVGLLALLDDYGRLVRCLPIGPIPDGEREPYRTVRKLVRLERVRLERLVRDRAHRGSDLIHLLGPARLYQVAEPEDRRVVRWPIEDETWPGEVPAPIAAQPDCPSRPGAKKERPEAVHREHRRLRVNAERSGVADLLDHFEHLPDHTASRVALSYLADAESVAGFAITEPWRKVLEAAVNRSPDDVRPAARLLLARIAERSDDDAEVERLYRAVLTDEASTAAQDSRARVRLVKRLEPRWPQVIAVVRGAERVRPSDEPVLINAEARALFSLGETEQLMSLGRRLVQRQDLWRNATDGKLGPFLAQTNELLTLLALDLPPARAIAWLDEIAIAGDDARSDRLEQLAERARERRDFDLAVALYDRRRAEVLEGLERRGPRAAAKDAELIGRRAYIEYDREDVEAFAGFVDALVSLATTEQGRPIARFAPHRAIARLTQDLIGRLTDDVKDDAEREKFAAVLLEAGTKLAAQPSRYRRVLERFQPDLVRLAGRWAQGRVAKPSAKRTRRRKAKPVKQLGQVVVPRLPPSLEAPDHATPVPSVATYLMYPTPEGAWREGAPWTPLVPKKKR